MIQHDSLLANVFNDRGIQALGLLVIWATLLLGSAWLIAGLLRRASSAVRYCVWQYALLGLLAAPAAFALLPGVPLGISLTAADRPISSTRRVEDASHDIASSSIASQAGIQPRLNDDLPTGPMREIRPAQAPPTAGIPRVNIENQGSALRMADSANDAEAPLVAWSTTLVSGWFLGVAGQLGWLLWCMGRARRLLRAAETVDDARILRLKRELVCRFSPGRQARLMKSREVRGPLLAGVLRPSILLPDDCAAWSDEKLRIVLSHELAHVERRDVFWQLAARAAAAVYWFHPLAWLALRRMRHERERACDDRVLSLGVPALDYAAGLAEFAAAMVGRPSPLVGSLGMAEQLPLEDRVRSILNASLPRHPASRRVRGLLLAATACVVLLFGAVRPFSESPSQAADEQKPNVAAKANGPPKPENKPAKVPTPKPAPKAEQAAEQEPKQLPTKGSMLVRVVGPEGEAIAGAKLFANVSSWNRNADWTKQGTIKNDNYMTGDDGSVQIKLPKAVHGVRLWVRTLTRSPSTSD